MPGGLMQLVAYGQQDVYLTGNPTVTFSRITYRRHTNFVREQNEQDELVNPYDINKWTIKYVIILETDRNMECPINLELIKLNDEYCKCNECKYNFSKEALMEAFNTNYTCPMCRAEWTDKTKYINKSQLIIDTNKIKTNKTKTNKTKTNKTKNNETKTNDLIANNIFSTMLSKTKHNKRFYYGK
jgi:hypothetical protein